MIKTLSFPKYVSIVLLCFLGLLNSPKANAQEASFWSHVSYGGSLGLSFGDGFFSGTLAPSAIYNFDNPFALGVALNGTYNSEKNFYESYIVGGSIIGLYNVIPEIQFSAEFEQLFVSRNYEDDIIFADENYWSPAVFLGVGYSTQNVTFGVRYDVLFKDDRSVYASAFSPFFRVYF